MLAVAPAVESKSNRCDSRSSPSLDRAKDHIPETLHITTKCSAKLGERGEHASQSAGQFVTVHFDFHERPTGDYAERDDVD